VKIYIVKKPIKREKLIEIAKEEFGDLVKAVVDIKQEIMAVGGELHSDEEVVLIEEHKAKRKDTWGVNIYPKKKDSQWIEFDSMINIKPYFGNRSRDVKEPEIKEKIRQIVKKLIID